MGTPVYLLLSSQTCQGVPFATIWKQIIAFAAAPLVLTPFVRNQVSPGAPWPLEGMRFEGAPRGVNPHLPVSPIGLKRDPIRGSGSWAVTFIPMPMPKRVCITFSENKWVHEKEVCIIILGRGMGMNITAQFRVVPRRRLPHLRLGGLRQQHHPSRRRRRHGAGLLSFFYYYYYYY